MKSRTSFFNIHILKKNLTRFAPAWILYTVAEILGVLALGGEESGWYAREIMNLMGSVAIFHCGYALIVAACLFGDLFDSRLCNGLHAMPMRREGLLITNLLSGFLFALIPAVIGGGFAASLMGQYAWVALIWQITSLLQFFFFFGLAVFSAMCAGKRLGMIAIYGILNFLSLLIFVVASTIYQPMLYGVVLSGDWFTLFNPLVKIVSHTYMEGTYDNILGFCFLHWNPEEWIYLWICTEVGIVFYGLSFLLYRKRHLETAGDFLSFRPAGIFFLVAYTFGVGTFLYYFAELFSLESNYLFLAVGMLIGYFTGWMLLERTVKIFTKKVLVGFAIFAVAFGGSLGLTVVDPFGVQTYIPAAEKIESVSLYPTENSYMYTMQRDFSGWYITDPAEIAQVQELHGQMITAPHDKPGETVLINVTYRLKNGIQVYRSYEILAEDILAEDLSNFLSDVRAIFHTSDWQELVENVQQIQIYKDEGGSKEYELMNPIQQQAVLEAIRLDAEAGHMAQPSDLHPDEDTVAAIDVSWWQQMKDGEDSRWQTVRVFAGCENTVAFLETLK